MERTEILFRIPSFAADVDDNNLITSNYVIQIFCPRSNRPGADIFIPEPLILRASTDEDVRLKLAPSDTYFPLGRYQVFYFKAGNPEPIHQETWLVPERKGQKSFPWQVASLSDPIPMPDDYFGSFETDWNGTYEITANQLTWLTNNPPVGTELTFTYTAAVTLDEMVEIPNRNPGLAHFHY